MNKGLVGVIIPIYKVEEYIVECIESILAQTYTNFRLILVDDGTPDNAGKICDEYARKDSRITVIHQENAGVTRARARGVEEASDCEFITFVDGDDTISTDALLLLTTTMSPQYDIVISKFEGYTYPESSSISINEYRHLLISESVISCGPHSKLFRRTIFDKHSFAIPRNIIHGEDLLMNVRLAFNTKKDIAILASVVYNYRQRPNGCNNTFKRTPEYESEYFKYMLQSIPSNMIEIFYNDTIKRRILILEREIGYRRQPEAIWFGSSFQQELLTDIKKHRYKYPLIKKGLFKIENTLLRHIMILIVKINNMLKRTL